MREEISMENSFINPEPALGTVGPNANIFARGNNSLRWEAAERHLQAVSWSIAWGGVQFQANQTKEKSISNALLATLSLQGIGVKDYTRARCQLCLWVAMGALLTTPVQNWSNCPKSGPVSTNPHWLPFHTLRVVHDQ